MNIGVVWVHKVFFVDYHTVMIYSIPNFVEVSVSSPTIRDNMSARKKHFLNDIFEGDAPAILNFNNVALS